MSRTYFDALWESHIVESLADGNDLLFIDRIVAHEITTPPGALQIERRFNDALFDPNAIVAVNDHVSPANDAATALQARHLRLWAKRHGIRLFDVGDNGICHVLVPERGLVRPGMTLCCGDSHTCTLGAFGAIAFGVGTTAQAGAMLAGSVVLKRPLVMRVQIDGALPAPAAAKDVALTVVRTLGADGGRGYALEYGGSTVAAMSMGERMTLCNMAIEAGATTGYVRPDVVTRAYLHARGEPFAGEERWYAYECGESAYAKTIEIDASSIVPLVTWGTNPAQSIPLGERVPEDARTESLAYMGIAPGDAIEELEIDQVFIGSCTNSRLHDLRAAAQVLRGRRVSIPTIVTPGSQAVKRAAESEGLHDVFQDAGALWTHSSCGPCLGMSMGVLGKGMRCVSTSNRNFPGRMGPGGRVHLASPVVAAASAVLGRVPTPSQLEELMGNAVCV
ncbi:MAG TPA: aconitase family protein [Candidatus Baltobacteraceae bacterium]|nr:aconitase family protein [Candidatus Baltobacteraceae bacterium]